MTTCKNCGHQITESYKFDYGMPNEKTPIRWEHTQKQFGINSYPTKVRCDAIYYGQRCMGQIAKSNRIVPCECESPEPNPYQPESNNSVALKLMGAYKRYIQAITKLDR